MEPPSKKLCFRPAPPGELPFPDPPPPSPTKSRRTSVPPVYKHHYFQWGDYNRSRKRLEFHIVPTTPERVTE